MRQYFSLLLVLAVLITAGCVEEPSPKTTVTTTQTQVIVTSTVTTNTPVQTPTSPPAEMAYLTNIKCAVVNENVVTYHCNGDVRIRSGAYDEVQVIARYPDNNTYKSGIFAMGGSNPIINPFFLFPDVKYNGKDPDYFVKLDKTLYPVIWSGDRGTAWSNLTAA